MHLSLHSQIKNILDKNRLTPKKSMGQNFLISEGIFEKIIKASEIKSGDRIIEIGSGLGTLTEKLLGGGANIIAIEKDREFIKILKELFRHDKKIEIIEEDILKFDPKSFKLQDSRYKIVGNIPYYLTSRLLRTIFSKWPLPELIILMVQYELAERMIALPPKSNMLAVSVQYFSEIEKISKVKKQNFWPQPDVDSAIVRLRPKENMKSIDTAIFFKTVKAGFSGKRKQLINSLSGSLALDRSVIIKRLNKADIDSKRRAETLTIDEWQKLTQQFSILS